MGTVHLADAGDPLHAESLAELRSRLFASHRLDGIVAHSAAMLRALDLAVRVAPLDSTVLITGPSGAGKEVLARAIHANSKRAAGPLVTVDCAAIPTSLLDSELFGQRRGTFNGTRKSTEGLLESARGGTLLLDEVAEVTPVVQAKLLRVLQGHTYGRVGSSRDRETGVRVVATTNVALEEAVRAGTLREDLYYRLRVFPIHVPPLAERREDIVPLAMHFLGRLDGRVGRPVPGLSHAAAEYLRGRAWRGNVRELRNAMERAVIVSRKSILAPEDFEGAGATALEGEGGWRLPDEGIDLEELVRSLTVQAVERSGSNVSRAARLLGISRATLRYRLKKYGLSGPGARRCDS